MIRWRKTDHGWTTAHAQWLSGASDHISLRLQSYQRFWDKSYCQQVLRDLTPLIPFDHGQVSVLGESESIVEVICRALTTDSNYVKRNITDAVRRFSDRCAPIIVAAGKATFEVVLLKTEEMALAPDSFYLMHVQNYRKRFLRPMQYVPMRGWKRLDGSQLVIFEMSKLRRAATQRAMVSLASASEYKNRMNQMLLNPRSGCDYKEYQRLEAIDISRVTRALGWNSLMFQEYVREPYQVSRYLAWQEFRLELRETVIKGLNRALRVAGDAMGFDVQLEVRGLPSREDIAEARNRLEHGRCGRLVDLIEPFI